MFTHLVVDVQIVIERVAASSSGAIVGDKRDIVVVCTTGTGSAHGGVDGAMTVRFGNIWTC